jgi:DNA-binding NarL/FixJ family response regulator/KaiC/GvpD/RAD55 family RecA-like ATPase
MLTAIPDIQGTPIHGTGERGAASRGTGNRHRIPVTACPRPEPVRSNLPGERERWLLAGWETELDAIGKLLGEGSSVLLVGDDGHGQTGLAREVLRQAADRGAQVEWIRASSGTSNVPFGSLMEWLGNDLVELVEEPARIQAEIVSRLRERLSSRSVLGVEKAHSLDPMSADVLYEIVASGRAAVVATVSSTAAAPEGVGRLWLEQLARRFDVTAFDRPAVAAVLQSALGGRVDERTTRRMHAVTLGNPLFLRELIGHALSEGTLRSIAGQWCWSGLVGGSGRLADLVRAQLGQLGSREWELVRLVSLAEPLRADLPLLDEFADVAESLNKRGILLAEGGDLRLRLAFPLFSEVVVAMTPALTSRRLRIRLADAIQRLCPRTRGDQLRTVVLRVDAGQRTPGEDLLVAARTATASSDFATVEKLCRAVMGDAASSPHAGEARMLLGQALASQGQHAEAEAVLSVRPDPDTPSLTRAELAQARAINMAWGLQRMDAAHAVLDEALDTLPQESAQRLHGTRALVWTMAGRVAEVADVGERLLPGEPPESLLMQSSVPSVAVSRTELGDAAGALALLERCVPALGRWEDRAWLDHQVATALSSFMMGRMLDVSGVLDRIRQRSANDGWKAGMAQSALLQARMDRNSGRLTEAVDLLRQAYVLQEERDLFTTRSWTLACAAGSLAEAGRTADAIRTLAEARALQSSESPFPFALDGIARETVLVHAYAGDRDGALRGALKLADQCALGGWTSRELGALHLAARIGGSGAVAARVAALARRTTSGLLRLQADHVAALAADDGHELAVVCEQFRAMGLVPLAAEAAAQSARAHRTAKHGRRARTAEELCRELLSSYGGPLPPWAVLDGAPAADSRFELTSREREIAVLAATGLANRQIATLLVVSVRTIENHLQRAYGKLGIDSRSGLANVLAL